MINNRKMKGSSYLLEVLANNSFQGQHILISEKRQAEHMGLKHDSFRTIASFPRPFNRGFRITRVPYTLGSLPGQDRIMQHYRDYPAVFQLSNKPIIGEIMSGPFRGRQVSLFNQTETRLYFGPDGVRQASRQQRVWRGIAWRYAQTHAEAEPFYCQPDNALLLTVFRYRFCYKDVSLSDEQQRHFRAVVSQVVQQLRFWFRRLSDAAIATMADYHALAKIYYTLANSAMDRPQYEKIRDTLHCLKDILAIGNRINTLLFLGHCKILERVANERV